jgi:hypothetical protein
MLLSHHRKAIVKAILTGLSVVDKGHEAAFTHEEQHKQGSTCVVTGLFFPDKLAEMQITISDYGPIWMGLWLDTPLKLDDEGDSNTLFPRWLAEVLNEECELGIEEEDVIES